MGMAAQLYYTADMVRALPDDGNRYETVYGELLVTPAPRWWHQEVLVRMLISLRAYLEAHAVGHAVLSPADISWGPDTLVQPDLFVVPIAAARTGDWTRMQRLLLVIEVLSPSTSRADRFAKRRLYQEQGVPLYWVIDGDLRTAEVWTPEANFPQIERERLVWQAEAGAEPFIVELSELFRPL